MSLGMLSGPWAFPLVSLLRQLSSLVCISPHFQRTGGGYTVYGRHLESRTLDVTAVNEMARGLKVPCLLIDCQHDSIRQHKYLLMSEYLHHDIWSSTLGCSRGLSWILVCKGKMLCDMLMVSVMCLHLVGKRKIFLNMLMVSASCLHFSQLVDHYVK